MLRDEIREAMSALQHAEGGRLLATFFFPPTFTGFQGHFPEHAVLPGVCTVQAVLVMLAADRHSRVQLKQITSAKFFAAAGPGEELRFDCRIQQPEAAPAVVKATVMRQDTKIADLSLKVACGEPVP